jgi:hypothetical protein
MPSPTHTPRPVPTPVPPGPDTALDAQARLWHLIAVGPTPHLTFWYCPATGASATAAFLPVGYGPLVLATSGYAAVTS